MPDPIAVSASTVADAETERRVFTKIGRRLMPVLVVGYMLNYLDRTNISFAAPTMNPALGLTPEQYGYGSVFFFLGYCFLELPSNMVLYKVGARRWISRIMISWGFASAAMSLAVGPSSFYGLRFLLGATEAGFFPGIAFYLSTWFPSEYRTRIITWFMVAIPLSTAIGAPLSSVLLQLDGTAGLTGWQWLFLLEGVPVVILGVALLWLLPDRPEDAAWLSDHERQIVSRRLESERKPKEVRHLSWALKDARVWTLAGIQFSFLVGSYGTLMFLPLILDAGGLTATQTGVLTGAIFACAVVGMVLWGRHVDRGARKITHLMLCCLTGAVGLFGAGFTLGDLWLSTGFFIVAMVGVNGARAIFWTIPPRFLSGLAAAGGLAFINSIGTMGGQVGPALMGRLETETAGYRAGTLALSAFLLTATTLAWLLSRRVRQDPHATADL